jgi:hypothetical protein
VFGRYILGHFFAKSSGAHPTTYERQRCSRLDRFFNVEIYFCCQNTPSYQWRCKNLQRWRIGSLSPWLIEILVLERVSLCWSSKHFGRKKPCKKSADLLLDKVIYYIGTIFLLSTKPLFTSQNRAEKNSPIFFNMRVLDLDFYALATIWVSFPFLCLQAFQISNLIREYIEVLQTGLSLTDEINRLNPSAQSAGNPIYQQNRPLSVLHKPNPMLVSNSTSGWR